MGLKAEVGALADPKDNERVRWKQTLIYITIYKYIYLYVMIY